MSFNVIPYKEINKGAEQMTRVVEEPDILRANPIRAGDDPLRADLEQVRLLIARRLAASVLGPVFTDQDGLIANGKMLRARLSLRMHAAAGVAHECALRVAMAVETVHAASLLHDDVIDGALLRRHKPAFWSRRGVPGAILLGDTLFFKAIEWLDEADPAAARRLILACGEVCEAETAQELVYRGETLTVGSCVDIARRKTGALFAFAASAAIPGEAGALLKESGYELGTAYQLADDLLDASGADDLAGKTLGLDKARAKDTAAAVFARQGTHPMGFIEQLLDRALSRLTGRAALHQAMEAYIRTDLYPTLRTLTNVGQKTV